MDQYVLPLLILDVLVCLCCALLQHTVAISNSLDECLVAVLFYDSTREKDVALASKEWSYSAMQKAVLHVDKLKVPVVTDSSAPYWRDRYHSSTVRVCVPYTE